MDNEPVTACSLGKTYMINSDTLESNYKNVLSNYQTWSQKDHASEWVLKSENMSAHLGIDETSIGNDVYTILHNKNAHGRKGAIIAIARGVSPEEVLKTLLLIPEEDRLNVKDVTMDLSESMRSIVRSAFPNAIAIRDCFHVIMRGGEGVEEVRMRSKREAVKEQKKDKKEFGKKLKKLVLKSKYTREKMKKQGIKPRKGKKRGRKPMRLNTRFVPKRLENGETKVEALTRCRTQLLKSRNKWNANQEKRAKILFLLYPKLEEAYNLIQSLRHVFQDKKLTKVKACSKLYEWYENVKACTSREIKSVKDTIKYYEDEILNYFLARQTNASAESLNSKLKGFRSSLRGVKDVSFFMYRVMTVLG